MNSSGPEVNTTVVHLPEAASSSPPTAPLPQYPGNHPQIYVYPGYQTQMIAPYEQEYMAKKIWNEGKVLGAIQILIGLMHIGFGSVLVTTMYGGYISISFVGGYPIWGGIAFIISGSLSVSAQQAPVNSCKINGSLGMNIVSSIFSVVGIMLFITDLSINWRTDLYYDQNNSSYYYYFIHSMSSGKGLSAMLLIFSILEFVITCTLSHSGCRIACCQPSQVAVVTTVPQVQIPQPVIIPQQVNPPFYSNVGAVQQ